MSEVKGHATDDNVHSERVRRIDMGCGQLMKLLSLIACGSLLVFQLSEKPVFLRPISGTCGQGVAPVLDCSRAWMSPWISAVGVSLGFLSCAGSFPR